MIYIITLLLHSVSYSDAKLSKMLIIEKKTWQNVFVYFVKVT